MKLSASDPNLETLVARIDRKALNLQPDFQRGEVWGKPKKQRLIDTILRDWHIPPLHIVVNSETGDREILDGQQRLAAIRDFVHGRFPINGKQEPIDEHISKLDGLYYSDLPEPFLSNFNDYSIRAFLLTDYTPEEPGELFYRLNQPTGLTSSEQRNAFYGDIRQQIKNLVSQAEVLGIHKELLGFSNSRMSYDDVLAKVALTSEQATFHKKITGGTVTERYRRGDELPRKTMESVESALSVFSTAAQSINTSFRLNKATWYSWLVVLMQWPGIRHASYNPKLTTQFATALGQFSDATTKHTQSESPFPPTLQSGPDGSHRGYHATIDPLLDLYLDRATSRVADVTSVLVRDFAIWCFLISIGIRTGNDTKDAIAERFFEPGISLSPSRWTSHHYSIAAASSFSNSSFDDDTISFEHLVLAYIENEKWDFANAPG